MASRHTSNVMEVQIRTLNNTGNTAPKIYLGTYTMNFHTLKKLMDFVAETRAKNKAYEMRSLCEQPGAVLEWAWARTTSWQNHPRSHHRPIFLSLE